MRKESSIIVSALPVVAGAVSDVALPDASSSPTIEVFVEAAGLVTSTLSVNLVTHSADGTNWDAVGPNTGGHLSHSAFKTQLTLDPAYDTNYSVEYLLPSGSTETVTLSIQAVYSY